MDKNTQGMHSSQLLVWTNWKYLNDTDMPNDVNKFIENNE